MEPIQKERVQEVLTRLTGQEIYLHLETTTGAYAAQRSPGAMAVSALIRNGKVTYSRGVIAGDGPYRVGLQMESGWVYAEGLTDFEMDGEGRLLVAGHDADGRLAVALELGTVPFPSAGVDRQASLTPDTITAAPVAGVAKERHVLLVFPHPDDEAFGLAGTVALHAAQGTPITYLCGTLGELGRNMGRPFFANRETLPQVREAELLDACKAMGITDLRMMGLHDKTVEFLDRERLADRIQAVLEEVQPSLVLTHYPGLSVHPDHDSLSAAAVAAVARLPEGQRPTVLCHAPPTGKAQEVLGDPDVVIDIATVAAVKMAALHAHRSQTEGILADWRKRADEGDAQAKAFWDRVQTQERFYTYRF